MSERASEGPQLGRRVLVPVANPASVLPLLACAARLAGPGDGEVELVTVLDPAVADARFNEATRELATAESHGERLGIRVRGHLLLDDDVGAAVLGAVESLASSMVLVGWRGASSTTDVFGRLIDRLVGRSTAPLAIIRLGAVPFDRSVLPVSRDHLLPGGLRGLRLAATLARRLRPPGGAPTTLLRTGPQDAALPPEVAGLTDRVHHDPRRTHHAVRAFARASDLVVTPVAPTASGLRAATTHLAWAAPEATLLVAVDVGPRRDGVRGGAGERGAPTDAARGPRLGVVVTVRLPDDSAGTDDLTRVLARVGETDRLMAWWPGGDARPHVRATVYAEAASPDAAMAAVRSVVDTAPELHGAEVAYDAEDVTVRGDDLAVTWTPTHPGAHPTGR